MKDWKTTLTALGFLIATFLFSRGVIDSQTFEAVLGLLACFGFTVASDSKKKIDAEDL